MGRISKYKDCEDFPENWESLSPEQRRAYADKKGYNKDKSTEKHRKYVAANKEKLLIYRREYVEKNKEKIAIKMADYGRKNREKLTKHHILNESKRFKNDPAFRAECNHRKRLRKVIKRSGGIKSAKTIHLLGCDSEYFKFHLESKFLPGMTWENYGFGNGKWVIDHIRPCASFDLIDPEQQKLCFYYTNLQPLWWIDNLRKGDKVV